MAKNTLVAELTFKIKKGAEAMTAAKNEVFIWLLLYSGGLTLVGESTGGNFPGGANLYMFSL